MMIRWWILFLCCVLTRVFSSDCADPCPPKIQDQPTTWKNHMRLKALNKVDRFLAWSISEKLKTFALVYPLEEETFEVDILEYKNFADNYGYFSLQRPIVGKVSENETDLRLVCCVLKALYEKGDDREYLQLATAEVLTKVLAYRDLQEGQNIQIPVIVDHQVKFQRFIVDRLFDLWNGMPAFGLIPEDSAVEPILLFRGTDFSFDSLRGWASLMSDLDIAGPGLTVFHKGREQIHDWLASTQKKAKVMGFSLGGALAIYTLIYENNWVAKKGSLAFCPPGIADKVCEDWSLLPEEQKQGFVTYVNKGDLVSQVGNLLGTVYVLSLKRPLRPLRAHTALITAEPLFFKTRVDVEKENSKR